jgi:uncharacterized protein YecT (DUF1311 family)
MSMRRSGLVFLSIFASVGVCRAADCANAGIQVDMNSCAENAFDATDAKLNALYKQIEARLKDDATARALLATTQRAWIGFRDAECAFSSAQTVNGSIHPMIVADCLDRLTQTRIKDFDAYLHCEEGDLGCPVPPN